MQKKSVLFRAVISYLLLFSIGSIFAQADLTISRVAEPDTLIFGETIHYTFYVKNIGNAPSSITSLQVYLSKDSLWDFFDYTLLNNSVPSGILPGDSAKIEGLSPFKETWNPGKYTLIMKVDKDNLLPDKSYTNNTVILKNYIILGYYGSKLKITSSDNSVYTDDNISVVGKIINNGQIPISSSYLYYFLSEDTVFDDYDYFITNKTFSQNLIPGDSIEFSEQVHILPDIPLGNYYLVTVTNRNSFEINTSDNFVLTPVTILKKTVALDESMFSVSLDISSAMPGGSVIITSKVKNTGSGVIPANYVYHYFSTDNTLSSDDIKLGESLLSYPPNPGLTSNLNDYVTIPNVVTGSYYVITKTDGDNRVEEFDETNNILTAPITISAVGHDVEVLSLSTSISSGNGGDAVTLSMDLRNNAPQAVGRGNFYFIISSDSVPEYTDFIYQDSWVERINGLTTETRFRNVTLPTNLTTGDYYVFGMFDYANNIPETNENNNCKGTKIHITNTTPVKFDAALRKYTPLPETLYINEGASIKFYIDNLGDAKWTSMYITAVLSKDTIIDASDIKNYSYFGAFVPLPGQSYLNNGTFKFINNPPVGNYNMIIYCYQNGSNQVELNTKNNYIWFPVVLMPERITDMGISAINTNDTLFTNLTDTIITNITNYGSANPTTYLYYYLSKDSILQKTDKYLLNKTINPIDPGNTYSQNLYYNFTDDIPEGDWILTTNLVSNTSTDVNLSNNTFYKKVFVKKKNIDLAITSAVTETFIITGDSYELSCTMKNNSEKPLDNVYYGIYLSPDSIPGTRLYPIHKSSFSTMNIGEEKAVNFTFALNGDISTDDYYIIFRVNDNNAYVEFDKSNNIISKKVRVQRKFTDYEITNNYSDSLHAIKGDTIYAETKISNIGYTTAAKVNVHYLISEDKFLSVDDIFVGKDTIDNFLYQTSRLSSLKFVVDESIAAGSYYLLVVLDSTNIIVETDENNNITNVPFEILDRIFDVTFGTVVKDSISKFKDQIVTITTVISNSGNQKIDEAIAVYYLSTDTLYNSTDILLGVDTILNFDPKTVAEVSLAFTIADSLIAGNYYILCVLDEENNIDETDETNNIKYLSKLNVKDKLVGELTFGTVSTNPLNAVKGTSIKIETEIVNKGNMDISEAYVHYFLSTDTTYAVGDSLIGIDTLTGFAKGTTMSSAIDVIFDSVVKAGNYYILCIIDFENSIVETIENNNFAYLAITISDTLTQSKSINTLSVAAYPNPVIDYLYIETEGNYSLQLFDMNGKLMINKNQMEGPQVLDINSFVSGVYILKVLSGDKAQNVKVVKE